MISDGKIESSRPFCHPVMWPQGSATESLQEKKISSEKPHMRIVDNVRRFFSSCKDPEERQAILERMLLSLPAASKDD